jgi:hypothetical protein
VTRLQAVGVVLIALGLIYALLYAAWLRKGRRHTSAAVAVDAGEGQGRVPAEVPGGTVVAEGTYVSTTTAASRHERVAVAGLGNRARATMTIHRGVPDDLIRWVRSGEADVVIPQARLLDVRRDRGMAGKFVGANRLLVVRWKADDGAVYETGFLPRHRADLDRLEAALWWHQGGAGVERGPRRTHDAAGSATTRDTDTTVTADRAPETREGDPLT